MGSGNDSNLLQGVRLPAILYGVKGMGTSPPHASRRRTTVEPPGGDPAHRVCLTSIRHLQSACGFLAHATYAENSPVNKRTREIAASARSDRVSEQPVGRLQGRDNGTAKRIFTGQMAAEQPTLTVAVWRENAHDDHVGVEGAHLFHTDQL